MDQNYRYYVFNDSIIRMKANPIPHRKYILRLWNEGSILAKRLANEPRVEADIRELHSIFAKLQNCKGLKYQSFFNRLLKKTMPNIMEFNTLVSGIQFNFDLFPGPEAVLACERKKEEEDRQAAEVRRKFWEEHERLAPERAIQERVGFGEILKHRISPITSALILRFIDDCQSPPETVDGPHAECNASRHYVGNFTVFEGEIDAFLPLFVTEPRNLSYEDRLHPFHREWISCQYDSKPTSFKYPKIYLYCPYCTILLICGIIIDNQKTRVKTGTHPGWNTYLDMIMVYGMQQRVHRRFHYLLMCVYLRSKFPINPRSSYHEWETNPIKAILGLDQSLQGHFIGALKGRFNQNLILQEMAKDERWLSQDAFMAWRKDPTFKP